jgi:hypothetical protein
VNKFEASKNVRMGLLLTLVAVMMGLIAWGWTALYLSFVGGYV